MAFKRRKCSLIRHSRNNCREFVPPKMARGNGIVQFVLMLMLVMSAAADSSALEEDTRTLDQIHEAALQESGTLVIYSAGITRDVLETQRQAFMARFPNISVALIAEQSKYQSARVNAQLATDSLVPDYIQLDSAAYFDPWKRDGLLVPYKPNGWSAIYKDFRDRQATVTGLQVSVHSTLVNQQLLPSEEQWPRNATDLLEPQFGGGRFAMTHPILNNPTVFWFKQMVDKFGWGWLAQFAAQNASFTCGIGPAPLLRSGAATAGIAFVNRVAYTGGNSSSSAIQFALPSPQTPFTIFTVRAAIVKNAKRPEAAKLYMNWLLDKNSTYNTDTIWSVRTDVPPKAGYAPIWEYPNSRQSLYDAFMRDAAGRELFLNELVLYLGMTVCDQSPFYPNLHPPAAN